MFLPGDELYSFLALGDLAGVPVDVVLVDVLEGDCGGGALVGVDVPDGCWKLTVEESRPDAELELAPEASPIPESLVVPATAGSSADGVSGPGLAAGLLPGSDTATPSAGAEPDKRSISLVLGLSWLSIYSWIFGYGKG